MAAALRKWKYSQKWRRRTVILGGVFAYGCVHAPLATESAIANGDTRSLLFVNNHTNEAGTFVYKNNGYYDPAVLEKLNWFMRDWRINEQIKMDTRLFDILWEIYQQSGSNQPIDVLSAYRSPQTNGMLRRRSRLVAEHSQHMEGRAVDAHFVDVGPAPIRDIAMRMQKGGVGFYPIGSTPWVHVDAGTVRYWPRMSRAAIARLFPDGKTVFIPADGKPMEGYAEAKAMIESRGGEVQTASSSSGGTLLGWLFGGPRGGGSDDEEESRIGGRVIGTGRGGTFASATASEKGEASTDLTAATASAPARIAVATLAPSEPSAVQSSVSTANSVDDTSPSGDTEAVAPLPPRKPNDLFADLNLAPMPPRRPLALTELNESQERTSSGDDLVATLIEHGSLPLEIVGKEQRAPVSALALVNSKRQPQSTPTAVLALARAAALAPPPLPPRRSEVLPEGVTSAPRAQPSPSQGSKSSTKPTASNPYGSLIIDAFNTTNSTRITEGSDAQRDSTP